MPTENEQQETAEETNTLEMSERDALIAAVREAGGTESVDVAAEEAAAAAPAPTTETPAAPAEEDKLTRLMKQREQSHREQEAARSSVRTMQEEAKRQADRIIEEARAEAKRISESETKARQERFRANPVEALRELGDPQHVADQVLTANTPEARERARQAAEWAELAKIAKDGQGARAELEKFKNDLAQEKYAELLDVARTQFLTTHATPEVAPYLHARCDNPEEVWDRCNALHIAWTKDGLVEGKDFDRSDLVAYLERQSKERVTKLVPTTTPAAPSSAAAAPAKGPGNAPKVSANGSRTLSAAQGSERRTSPKPLSEMTPDQQRQALIEEVAAARRNNPDAVM